MGVQERAKVGSGAGVNLVTYVRIMALCDEEEGDL